MNAEHREEKKRACKIINWTNIDMVAVYVNAEFNWQRDNWTCVREKMSTMSRSCTTSERKYLEDFFYCHSNTVVKNSARQTPGL